MLPFLLFSSSLFAVVVASHLVLVSSAPLPPPHLTLSIILWSFSLSVHLFLEDDQMRQIPRRTHFIPSLTWLSFSRKTSHYNHELQWLLESHSLPCLSCLSSSLSSSKGIISPSSQEVHSLMIVVIMTHWIEWNNLVVLMVITLMMTRIVWGCPHLHCLKERVD